MTLNAQHHPVPSAGGQSAHKSGPAREGVSLLQGAAHKSRNWLQSRHLPWYLAVLAMLLCAPSLWLGWQFDDEFHRLALTQPEGSMISRSPAELFVFIEGDEAVNRQSVVLGMLPWWSHEKLRLAFFRPLTGLIHWIDYRLWPELPSLMHLHSLVWLGAVVVAATFFYRRMLGATWVAGLAALLFAVDDAHGPPVVWLANRNTLIGVFFGLLTLIAHDRWRRNGSWTAAIIAPLVFLLGLLSKESAVAIGAYLVAHALFIDRGKWRARLGSLAPYALVGTLWWVAYKQMEYGTVGSGWYVDPSADPMGFAQAVAARAPALLAWQWLIPPDLEWALSKRAAHILWLAAIGCLVIVAAALVPLLKRDSLARFWAVGMILSVLPACTAFPQGRLLFFVGIGGMGLLAQFLAAVTQRADWLPTRAWRRLPVGAICVALVFIHLCMAPRALARTAGTFKRGGRSVARAADSLPSDAAARFQTVLLVSTPSYATFAYSALTRLSHGNPYLSRTLVLGSGCQPIEIHRPDEHTLLVRPDGGFLAQPGNPQSGSGLEQLLFDQRRVLQSVDRLYRDSAPMTIGQRIGLFGVTVEITEIADDGRPTEAAFHFALGLGSPIFRWLQWEDGAYVPLALPAVGETVTLPGATVSF